tara:strand:- start:5257 stop:5574 length:318 start_codon:yes stop_codon:yes gene_type:complete
MGNNRQKEHEEKAKSFKLLRMLSSILSEDEIMERITTEYAAYKKSGNKEERPIASIMLLSVKWGDEAKGRSLEDSMDHTDQISEAAMIRDEMNQIKKDINDDVEP